MSDSDTSNLLRNRFHVNTIPIYDIQDGKCGCGKTECRAVGKHTISWAREAREGENYGIRTGSGLGVLDIDLKGRLLEDVLTKVEEAFGPLPETFSVSTGGGGLHFYFRCDTPTKNMVDILGPRSGVDFRGEGGMVVGPGVGPQKRKTLSSSQGRSVGLYSGPSSRYRAQDRTN